MLPLRTPDPEAVVRLHPAERARETICNRPVRHADATADRSSTPWLTPCHPRAPRLPLGLATRVRERISLDWIA